MTGRSAELPIRNTAGGMIGGVFVRFVVGSDGQHHKELTGIITEARLLRDRGELTAEEDVRLAELYEWFNEHVLVPPFSTGRFPRDAVYIADEAFMTGTAAEVTPVRELDDRSIGAGAPGPITIKVQEVFHAAVQGRDPRYKNWLHYV